MAAFVKVAKTDEIASGQARGVEVNGKGLALFNVDGNVYALDDTCTHKGGPLSEGAIAGEEVTCPWHKAKFNIRTGHVLGPPARRGVGRYNVRVTGTDIEVEVYGTRIACRSAGSSRLHSINAFHGFQARLPAKQGRYLFLDRAGQARLVLLKRCVRKALTECIDKRVRSSPNSNAIRSQSASTG